MMTRWQNKEVELEAEIRRRVILVHVLPVTAQVAGGPGPDGAGPFEPQIAMAGQSLSGWHHCRRRRCGPGPGPSLALLGSLRLTRRTSSESRRRVDFKLRVRKKDLTFARDTGRNQWQQNILCECSSTAAL